MGIPCRDIKYVEYAKSLLTSEYSGKPVIESIITAVVSRYQALEHEMWSVLNGRLLGSAYVVTPLYDGGCGTDPELTGAEATEIVLDAEGSQLDVLGDLIGQRRLGLSDADYAIWLRARVAANRSRGRAKDVTGILKIVTDLGGTYAYSEQYPAGFYVERTNTQDASVAVTADVLRAAKPAGVAAHYAYFTDVTVGHVFTLSPLGGIVSSNDLGTSYTGDNTIGGVLEGVVVL